MIINTKYSIGDVVWHISQERTHKWVICEFCEGSGEVFGKNEVVMRCSECQGDGGHRTNFSKPWVVKGLLTIGEVDYRTSNEKTEERYMCIETGIGGGRVYHVNRLHPTEKLAQAECDRRNSEPQ